MKDHHREAFALMTYACKHGCREVIWNSRDGVTPFGTLCRIEGHGMMQHVDWQNDKRDPMHTPVIGDHVFVDISLESLVQHNRKKVERYWGDPQMSHVFERYDSQEEAAQDLARQEFEEHRGAPEKRVVNEGFLEWLKTHRNQVSEVYR